jgi:hypothetical protein
LVSRRALLVASCTLLAAASPGRAQSSVDLEREKAELLRLHRNDREAHFKTDVALLQERTPDVMISVANGRVRRVPKAEQRQSFTEWFRGATYQEWDDLEDPIVRVSNDATMAWIITRLRVRRLKKGADGVERQEGFVYAGIMTYEKVNGRWMKVANVSTVEPP